MGAFIWFFGAKKKGKFTMIDISLNKITMNYGFGDILKEISLEIKHGDKVALIGANGCGKTTILKLIMKLEETPYGDISIRKNATIGYLGQIEQIQEDCKVEELLYKSVEPIVKLEKELKYYEEKMEKASLNELEKLIVKYTNVQEKFISLGGYEILSKISKIVHGFKIEHLLELSYQTLSGGEKRMVSFAMLMIKNPDILLLDEPTNHLDISTLEWLEKFLKNYTGTLLIVSHDRYFLDKIIEKTILLEDGNLTVYNGNYSYYVEENEKQVMNAFKEYKDQQKQIKAMQESIKKLREFGRLGNNERFFKRAKAIEKRLDKLEKMNKPKEKASIPLTLQLKNRSGNEVLIVSNLTLCFSDKILLKEANMKVWYQDHICLLGKNGSGKSTLIKEIIQNGENIQIGANVKIGYIPQEIVFLENKTVYDIARESFKGEETHLRSTLSKFMFTKNTLDKKTKALSGGEKVRLKLFCLMQEDINFLILDEPTNHIDLMTREILEDTLKEYEGTLLFVSHDRYFINNLAKKIIAIEEGKLIEYIGNYDDYMYQRDNEIF